MPIGFPSSPTVGQQWPAASPRWQWDGAKWVAIAGTAGGLVATPITDSLTTLAGSDALIALRGGVPYLATMAAVQTFVGGVPSASAPDAFTAGQWTLTAGTEAMTINVTALPADGGSAITALQYRIGTGAAVALTGAGTGPRTITGLTGGVAIDVQLRAVNAIGAGAWSDVKAVTPAAAGAGGAATWLAVASTEGNLRSGVGVTPARPAGTTATDLLVLSFTDIQATAVAALSVPAGWTFSGAAYSDFGGGLGVAYYTAAGSVADALWQTSIDSPLGVRADMHRVSGANLAAPVRQFEGAAAHLGGFALSSADLPSPSVTAVAGDVVISHYHQPQSTTAVGAAPAGYTRVVDGATPNRRSVLARSNMPAGATGPISHAASASWEGRAAATVLIAAA